MGGRNVYQKLIWTAITRGVSLRNPHIGMMTEAEPTVRDFERSKDPPRSLAGPGSREDEDSESFSVDGFYCAAI